MSWVQVSVSLYPPNWTPTIRIDEKRKSKWGPVRLLDCQRAAASEPARAVDPEDVRAFLLNEGFEEWWCPEALRRGTVTHGDFTENEVDAFIGIEGEDGPEPEEVAHLGLRFAVSDYTPQSWPAWKDLVERICSNWDMKLLQTDWDTNECRLLDRARMLEALESNPKFREWRDHYGWDTTLWP